MGGIFNGGGGSAPAPVVQQPKAIVYQSSDPYAPNYKPPTGVQGATPKVTTNIPEPIAGETPEQRRARLAQQALILGGGSDGLGNSGEGTGSAAGGNASDGAAAAAAGTGDGF